MAGLCYNSGRRMNLRFSDVNNLLPIATLSLIGAFQLATIQPGLTGGEDSALYLLHARNIAFGRPYLATGYIYSIETANYSPAGYPPVFPVLLAPIFRFNGPNPGPYKVLMVSVLVLSLLVIALLYRRSLSLGQLLLLLLLLGCNPYITEQKNEVLSDLPFLLFVYVALLLFGDVRERTAESSSYLQRAFFAGFFSYLAYGTRTIGIGIIFSIIPFVLFRYRRVPGRVIVAVVTFTVFAGLQSRLVSINSDYIRTSILIESTPLQNLRFYAGAMSHLWDAGIGAFPRFAIFAIATSLSLVGAFRQSFRSLDLPTFFCLGYGLFLVCWPHQQARYLLPVIPVYLYYLVRGLNAASELAARRSQTAGTLTVALLTGFLLVAYAGKYTASGFTTSLYAWDNTSQRQLYALVRTSTPVDAVIIASAPRALALYTERQTAQFPEQLDTENFVKYITKIGATYVLMSRTDVRHLASLSAYTPEAGFSNPNYILYKTTVPTLRKLNSP
jgi:hypothetical protein